MKLGKRYLEVFFFPAFSGLTHTCMHVHADVTSAGIKAVRGDYGFRFGASVPRPMLVDFTKQPQSKIMINGHEMEREVRYAACTTVRVQNFLCVQSTRITSISDALPCVWDDFLTFEFLAYSLEFCKYTVFWCVLKMEQDVIERSKDNKNETRSRLSKIGVETVRSNTEGRNMRAVAPELNRLHVGGVAATVTSMGWTDKIEKKKK